MTDIEINALIAELSTSDTFPAFKTANDTLLHNKDEATGLSLNKTPEAISVAQKLCDNLASLPVSKSAPIVAKVMASVSPKQAGSLWETFLSYTDLKKFVMLFQPSPIFCTVLRDYVYRQAKYNPRYDIEKMTDDEMTEHIAVVLSVTSDEDLEQYKNGLSAKFPPQPQ